MNELIKALEGRKTYAVAALGALLVFLKLSNLIDEESYKVLIQLDIFAGLATLRAGVSK